MKVSFIELELTNHKIEEWFPEIEEQIGRRLPLCFQLEGGIQPRKDGTVDRWPGSHYYLCIPSEFVPLLQPFGRIIYSIEKEVDESTVNEHHDIYYWGPGCQPKLVPRTRDIS